MGYKVQCLKCGQVLMEATGDCSCFLSEGAKLTCRSCGYGFIFDKDMLLESNHVKDDKKDKDD